MLYKPFCLLLGLVILPPCKLHVQERKPWERYLDYLRPAASDAVQEEAARGLAERLLPQHHHLFDIRVDSSFLKDKKDVFKVTSPKAANDSRVFIEGTTGVAASWGILHYLKYFCNAHISWEADQLRLPHPLPAAHVKIVAADRLRYYQNVCTVSYSFAWWKWERWERHIDWMALNGINFPLAFTAQEAVWRKVFLQFNFTDNDLNDFFVGPAFLAWGRMGNIQKWQGPLSATWHRDTLALQHRILYRMRSLGMTPVLPAFAGHVPAAITRLYPEAKVTRLPNWGKFKSDNYTRTYLLDPNEILFAEIGAAFMREMEAEFNGTDHAYNCDTFNEMVPANGSSNYLRGVGKAIFKAMLNVDPKAIWVMQGWLFRNTDFWNAKRAKALVSSVPQGKMIILDLASEVSPEYVRLSSYFGQPFIFCLLLNYGGVNGFFGNAQKLLQNMKDARKFPNVTLVGTGLTPEGINQNYVMFDLMLELAWRRPEDVHASQWARDYSRRRYGRSEPLLQDGWEIMMNTVYNCHEDVRYHGRHTLIQHRPDFLRMPYVWYNESAFADVWDKFIGAIPQHRVSWSENMVRVFDTEWLMRNMAAGWYMNLMVKKTANFSRAFASLRSSATFKHDIVDVTRQAIQLLGGNLIEDMRLQYLLSDPQKLNSTGNLLLDLLEDLDTLLGTSPQFLLGSWLQDAASWGSTNQEKESYIKNAKYQITLWGPTGEILDYAVKQWKGLVGSYLKPRWKMFMESLLECLDKKTEFNQGDFDKRVFWEIEKPFAESNQSLFAHSSEAEGDPFVVAKEIYSKYRHLFDKPRGTSREMDSQPFVD